MVSLAFLKPYQSYISALATGYGLMGINMIAQLLLIPFYLIHLDTYQFGVLMMILSFFNFANLGISWMSSGGLRIMGEYYARQDRDNLHQSYVVARTAYILYALLIAAIMAVAALWFIDTLFHPPSSEDRSVIVEALCYAAVYFVVMYDFSSTRMPLIAAQKQATSNILQVISVILFALLVVVSLNLGGGLREIFISLIVSNAVMAIVTQYTLRKTRLIDVRLSFDPARQLPILKRLMGRMGGGFFVYGIIFTALQADIMIVGLIGGPEAAAAFTLVWKIAEVIIQLIGKIPEHLGPYLIALDAQKRTHELRRLVTRSYMTLVAISIPAALAYALWGERLVSLWVGPENVIKDSTVYLLAGGAIFWLSIAKLPINVALATARLKLLIIGSFIELLCKLAIIYYWFFAMGFSAALMAINVVHASGVAILYGMIVFRYLKHLNDVDNIPSSR